MERRRGELYLTLDTLKTSGEKKGQTIPYALHSQNQWAEQVEGEIVSNALHSQNQWGEEGANHTLRSTLSNQWGEELYLMFYPLKTRMTAI